MVAQIGEGDIVSEQEREPVIVIFKVDALSHSLGILVDKAEDAVVAAASLLIHEVGLKLQPKIVVFPLDYILGIFFTVTGEQQRKLLRRHEKAVVQNVVYLFVAYLKKQVAGQNTQFFGNRAFFNSGYPYHTFSPSHAAHSR